jgi:hypothetical protein
VLVVEGGVQAASKARQILRRSSKKKEELSACRGEGSAAEPLLAARALPLRCAASTVLTICTGYA